MCEKRKKAYMTIEASLLIPMILGGIILLLYIGFYLYNSCVIKQTAYVAALRGSQIKNESISEIETYVEQQINELLNNRILAKGKIEKDISVFMQKVKVRINVDIKMPFTGLLYSDFSLWEIESTAEANRINPVDIIREVRRINGSEISK